MIHLCIIFPTDTINTQDLYKNLEILYIDGSNSENSLVIKNSPYLFKVVLMGKTKTKIIKLIGKNKISYLALNDDIKKIFFEPQSFLAVSLLRNWSFSPKYLTKNYFPSLNSVHFSSKISLNDVIQFKKENPEKDILWGGSFYSLNYYNDCNFYGLRNVSRINLKNNKEIIFTKVVNIDF